MLTDNQIINQVLEGNVQAYRHLVDKYRDMAYTVALKLMKDSNAAEEVAQEAFIKAFEKLNTFKGDAAFSTWLYTIVYRTGIYQLRKHNPLDGLDDQSNFIKLDSHNAIEQLEQSETKTQVKQAIDKLPRLEATIITLYYLDEKSIDEISTITDLSKSNIKVKLFRARKKLKNLLEHVL